MKASEANKYQHSIPPTSTAPPLYPLLSELPHADFPSFSLLPSNSVFSISTPLTLPTDQRENYRNSDKDNAEILSAPFKKKPVSGRDEPVIIYN